MFMPTGARSLAAATCSMPPSYDLDASNYQDASLAMASGPNATFAPPGTTYHGPTAPFGSLPLTPTNAPVAVPASAIITSQGSQPINQAPVPPHQEVPLTPDPAPTNAEFVAAAAQSLVAFVLAQAHLHSCQARAESSATQLQIGWDTCAILTAVATGLGFAASDMFATCAMANEAPFNLIAAPMMAPAATTSTAMPAPHAEPATLAVPAPAAATAMAVPSASASLPLLSSVQVPANVELLSAANTGDNDMSYPPMFEKCKTRIEWQLFAENKVFKTIECDQSQGSEGQAPLAGAVGQDDESGDGDEEHDSDDDDDDDELEGGDPGQSQGGANSNSSSATDKPKSAKKIHLRKFRLNLPLQSQASSSQSASEYPYVARLFKHTNALDAVLDEALLGLDSVTTEMLVSECHGCVDLAKTQPILPLHELYAQYGTYRLVVSVGGVVVTGIPKMLRLYSYRTRGRHEEKLAESSAAQCATTSTVSSPVPNAPPSPPLTPTLAPLDQHVALPPSTAAAKKRASAKRKAPSQAVPGSQDPPMTKKRKTSSKPRAVATTECTTAAKPTKAAKRARKP